MRKEEELWNKGKVLVRILPDNSEMEVINEGTFIELMQESNKELLEENEKLKDKYNDSETELELAKSALETYQKENHELLSDKEYYTGRISSLSQQLQESQQMNERLVELVRDLEPIMIAWSATTSHGLPIHKQHQEVLDRIKALLQSTTQEKGEDNG